MKTFRGLFFVGCAGWLGLAGVGRTEGLQAQLDYPQQKLVMNQPTVLSATLVNRSTATLYITGIRMDLSRNVSASLYKEDLLLQQLRTLAPGQSWDGPLLKMTPSHRGPLVVGGGVLMQGGASPSSTTTLASLALLLPIDDPKRDRDGSFLRGVPAECDRPAGSCCDAEEASCFQKGGHCVYIAEGFNAQRVCSDRFPGGTLDHVADLQVSSDGAHEAYMASDHCSTDRLKEFCRDQLIVDGVPAAAPPAWASFPADALSFIKSGKNRPLR